MDNTPFINYRIEDRSFVSYIKREIHNLVKDHFSRQRTGEIDIIVSEITSNIIKHAQKGELLYRFYKFDDTPVFELIALDQGPGIKDLHLMMKDGVSSTNTLGHGLGSIKRLSNFSQIYSQPNSGTITYCQVCSETQDALPEELGKKILIRAISVAKPGEEECGDGYCVRKINNKIKLILGDGLGHGPVAHAAVQTALNSFNSNIQSEDDPGELLKIIHKDVKKTRGLVATAVTIDSTGKTVNICGIGNIATRLYNGIVLKNNMPYNGIIGLNIPSTIHSTSVPMEKNQTLIMCSDGITSRWDLSKYVGILKYDPMIIAALIYRDHGRKTDDMSILIAKVK